MSLPFLKASSWSCAPPLHGIGSGGKPQISWIGRWGRLRVFLLLGGIVSEPATTGDRWMAASSLRGLLRRGIGFCFGNDDGVERSSGRSMDFGSRFFPTCLRCPSVWRARSAQVLHISLSKLVVKVGADGCLRVWPSVGMCRRGFGGCLRVDFDGGALR